MAKNSNDWMLGVEIKDVEQWREGEYQFEEDIDEVIADAEAKGFRVYIGNDRRLLLDLDTPASLRQYERVLPILQDMYELVEVSRWPSKSGHGTHVVLECNEPLTVLERYGMQAMLGSDGVREALSVRRWLHGLSIHSLLFRPKKK